VNDVTSAKPAILDIDAMASRSERFGARAGAQDREHDEHN
jgi:hypothetical protein